MRIIATCLCLMLCSCGTWRQLSTAEKWVIGIVGAGAVAYAGYEIYDRAYGWLDTNGDRGEVIRALAVAEGKLDMTLRGELEVTFVDTDMKKWGRYVIASPDGSGALAMGWTTRGKVYVAIHDGQYNPRVLIHEMGHAILKSRNVPDWNQHKIMKKRGFELP